MMSFIKYFVTSTIALFFLCVIVTAQPQYEPASDSPKQQSSAATYLRVNGKKKVSVSFGPSGGMKDFTVGTDGSDYDVSSLPAWCSVDKYGTSFSLTCAQNQASSDRSGWFNVVSGDKIVKVNISQYSSGSDVAKERRIDISSSYLYSIHTSSNAFDSLSPAELKPRHFSTLSLSMGLNLYKNISAYFDLGIQDHGVKNAINWAGRIGSKHFELQLDYNFISGEVRYWNDANIGGDKNTPPDVTTDYDQTWMTVALMPRFEIFGYYPVLGIFYNHATVPALVWVNRESEDKEKRFAFLDKSCPVTTYGIRINYAFNKYAFERTENLSRGWTVRIPFEGIFDLGFGFADPDKDVVAMATEKGGHFSDYSFPTFYFGGRLTLLAAFFNRFTENNIVHVSCGFGVNEVGYVKYLGNKNNVIMKEESNNWGSVLVGGWTSIVRVGYVW